MSSSNWLAKLQRKQKWKTPTVHFPSCRKDDFWLDPMRHCPCYVCRSQNDSFDPKKRYYFSLWDTKGNVMGKLCTTEAELLSHRNKICSIIAKRDNKQLQSYDPTSLCSHCKEAPCIMLTNREKYLAIGDELRKNPSLNNRDVRYILYRVVFEDWFEFHRPKKRKRELAYHRGAIIKITQDDIPLCAVLELQANYPEVPPLFPPYTKIFAKQINMEEQRLESLIGNYNVISEKFQE